MTQQSDKDASVSETTTPPTTPVTVKKPALCGFVDYNFCLNFI